MPIRLVFAYAIVTFIGLIPLLLEQANGRWRQRQLARLARADYRHARPPYRD